MAIAERELDAFPAIDLVELGEPSGGVQRSYEAEESRSTVGFRRFYLGPRAKFGIATVVGSLCLGFSLWISLPWIHALAKVIWLVPACVVVALRQMRIPLTGPLLDQVKIERSWAVLQLVASADQGAT